MWGGMASTAQQAGHYGPAGGGECLSARLPSIFMHTLAVGGMGIFFYCLTHHTP